LNRRIGKTVNGVSTTYIYDGANIIQESTNGIKTNYVRTLGIDEPLSKVVDSGTGGSAVYHYLKDGLGSTIGLVDDNGNSVASLVYDAYGKTASTESFGFTGRENDGTGLMYYRARYYSPEMKRFISRDPIGFAAGDVNLYRYVNNNPINYIDPLGLFVLYAGPSGGAAWGTSGVTDGAGSYVSSTGEGGFYSSHGNAHGGILGGGFNAGFQTGGTCDFKGKSNYVTLDVAIFSITFVYNSSSWGLSLGAGPGLGLGWGQSNTKIRPN
jgi:RHS repeat-associated protein